MIDCIYKAVLRSAFGLSMGAIWQHMSIELLRAPFHCESRVDFFFSLMGRLMSEGNIRLAHNGNFLTGTIQDQLGFIKNSWPNKPDRDDLDGFGLWFITEAPAGVVWIDSCGKEVWT